MSEFTEYQLKMAKTYNLNPAYIPAEEPEYTYDGGGYKRSGPGTLPKPTPTRAQLVQDFAGTYGVRAEFVDGDALIADVEQAERDAQDARRLARRAEIAAKYGVPDNMLHTIPLEWLDK